MILLSLEDLLMIARRVVGGQVAVRDFGLLDSAAARPSATVFGQDAYPSIHVKAAALVHSVVSHHGLVDGNKRLGLAAVIVFYGINGYKVTATNDAAYEFIMQIADGKLSDVARIAEILAHWVE
ncbi:type II toxin-antitoxin system death-on-curing family toxin [Nakamurella antarctica]|uniref:Type II toxin-antitoxin system death-on-curing family toxin n=1 Tax=Nakamurella antarctica TaxID=1902245 RepID=A0A3G8ZYB0_9ACTN|nr:type II toxin-antitoxin system death-on-curing family toxin [Nakamurella antarctica]AZI59016.1 type II toxin-antitoxin system death-on-curing family toxin [Nakamurella antarctica]